MDTPDVSEHAGPRIANRRTSGELLKAALGYAAMGIPVLPVRAGGKVPLVKDWTNAATTDPDRIRALWREFPNANIGVLPGLAGYVALDVDPRNGGDEDLGFFESKHGALPETLVVGTGEYDGVRGRHIWFRVDHADTVGKGELSPGVEFKGTTGFVLAPPSLHPSGIRYEVISGAFSSISEAPSWVRERVIRSTSSVDSAPDPSRLTEVPLGRRALSALRDGFLPAPEDGQNHRSVAVGIARNLREAGTPQAVALWSLTQVLMDDRSCLNGTPWTVEDAERIVRSVYSAPAPDQASYLAGDPDRFQLLTLADAIVAAKEEVDWVVPDLLAAGEKALIAGPPKSMKTWLALHLMHAVATADAVLAEDAWRVRTPQPVVFVQEEGSRQRWAIRLAQVFADDADAPFYYLHRAGFSLVGSKRGEIAAPVRWVAAEAKRVGARLIVIDPWQRVTPGVKENDAADTGPAWDAIHFLATETGAAVVVIHHANKGDGRPSMDSIRGSSRMAGEVDLMVVMKKQERGTLEVFLDGRDLVRSDDEGGNLEVEYIADRPHEMRARGFKVRLKTDGAPRVRDAIAEVLSAHEGGATTSQVVDLVTAHLGKVRSRQAVTGELQVLANEGRVTKTSLGKGQSTTWTWSA